MQNGTPKLCDQIMVIEWAHYGTTVLLGHNITRERLEEFIARHPDLRIQVTERSGLIRTIGQPYTIEASGRVIAQLPYYGAIHPRVPRELENWVMAIG